jgi:transposase
MSIDSVVLNEEQQLELSRIAQSRSLPAGYVFRARLILMLAEGASFSTVKQRLGTTAPTIIRWKQRFLATGLDGLDTSHPGQPASVLSPKLRARILSATRKQPKDGSTHWSCRKLAAALGVSKDAVHRVWKEARLKPHRLERYMASDDPDFETKAADIIGLYLNPPQHAAVFCVDEKTFTGCDANRSIPFRQRRRAAIPNHSSRSSGQPFVPLLAYIRTGIAAGTTLWISCSPFDPSQGLRFDASKVLLDPYGRGVTVPLGYSREAARNGGDNSVTSMKSVVVDPHTYDWEGDAPLHRPSSQTVIYEMHVGGFTRHPNSGLPANIRGTFAGLIEKIRYLRDLGITAVELLRIFQFDAQDCPPGRVNYWGYQPVSFFAPHSLGPVDEFRDMVKALHRSGIEVILDVVYNHTAEGNDGGPTLSFRGLDNNAYYILEGGSRYANYAGTGNTVNGNHPIVRRMIVDSMRRWAEEMHVEAFVSTWPPSLHVARQANSWPISLCCGI